MGDRRPGFVPGRVADVGGSGAALSPNSPMSLPDPNADLIGLTYGDGITVTGTCEWNPAYVAVDTPRGPSCRVAAQVRGRKEIRS